MSGPCATSSAAVQSFFLAVERSSDLQSGLALQVITATRQAWSPAVTPESRRAGTRLQAGSTPPPTRQSSKRAGVPNLQGSRLQEQSATQAQQSLVVKGRKRDLSTPQAASSTTSDSAGSSARQSQATTAQRQAPGINPRANALSGQQQRTSQAARSEDEQEAQDSPADAAETEAEPKPTRLISDEQRRQIAQTQRRRLADPEERERISKALLNRRKTCSYCGQEGHNRKGCPELHGKNGTKPVAEARPITEAHRRRIAESMRRHYATSENRERTSKSMMHRPKVCSYCGQEGHNRKGCPELKQKEAEAVAEADSQTTEAAPLAQEAAAPPEESLTGQASTAQTAALPELPSATQQATHFLPLPRQGDAEAASGLDQQPDQEEAGTGAERKGPSRTRINPRSCSVCGQPGHDIRNCPQAHRVEELIREWGPLGPLEGPETVRLLDKRQAKAWKLPLRMNEALQQAVEAVLRARAAGERRLTLELMLPQEGMSSQQTGWPGGIRQQAKIMIPAMVEPLLVRLNKQEGLQGRLSAQWLDESDCVGAWQSSNMAAAVFPTADTLPQLQQLAGLKGPQRLTLLLNPQWSTTGQVVSDFGFGQARKDAEQFLGTFTDIYVLERVSVMGDDARLLKCYPGGWQVHYMWPNGQGSRILDILPRRPTYRELLDLLKRVAGTRSSRSWVDRVLSVKLPLLYDEPVSAAISDSLPELGSATQPADGNGSQRLRPAGNRFQRVLQSAARTPASDQVLDTSMRELKKRSQAGHASSRSFDAQDSRFGSVDLDGKRVRNVLDPVQELSRLRDLITRQDAAAAKKPARQVSKDDSS